MSESLVRFVSSATDEGTTLSLLSFKPSSDSATRPVSVSGIIKRLFPVKLRDVSIPIVRIEPARWEVSRISLKSHQCPIQSGRILKRVCNVRVHGISPWAM